MALSKNLVSGLLSLFRKRKAERELDEELRDDLDQSIAEKMCQGMRPGTLQSLIRWTRLCPSSGFADLLLPPVSQ
jgi:hypothetical protein